MPKRTARLPARRAATRCSPQAPSSIRERVGRRSTKRCPAPSRITPIPSTAWCAPRSPALAAVRTSVTCSTMGRRRAASAIASTRSVSISMGKCERRRSNSGVPLVAEIFPEPTASPAHHGKARYRLDALHVLGVLVAQLALDAQADRRAMRHAQRRAVHVIGEDRLRMEGVDQVDALVIFSLSLIHISEPTRRTPISYA